MNMRIVPDRAQTVNSCAPAETPGFGSRLDCVAKYERGLLYHFDNSRAIVNLDQPDHAWPLPAAATVLQEIAFGLGQGDAAEGWLAVPEMFFTRRDLQCYYCRGYVSIAGPTLGTSFFLKD